MFGPSIPAPSSLLCRGEATLLFIPPEVQSDTNLFAALSDLQEFVRRRHATLRCIESCDRVSDDDVVTDCATGILGPCALLCQVVHISNKFDRSVAEEQFGIVGSSYG